MTSPIVAALVAPQTPSAEGADVVAPVLPEGEDFEAFMLASVAEDVPAEVDNEPLELVVAEDGEDEVEAAQTPLDQADPILAEEDERTVEAIDDTASVASVAPVAIPVKATQQQPPPAAIKDSPAPVAAVSKGAADTVVPADSRPTLAMAPNQPDTGSKDGAELSKVAAPPIQNTGTQSGVAVAALMASQTPGIQVPVAAKPIPQAFAAEPKFGREHTSNLLVPDAPPARLNAKTTPLIAMAPNVPPPLATASVTPVLMDTMTAVPEDAVRVEDVGLARAGSLTSQSVQTTTAQTLAGPATARHVASQMAIAVTQKSGGPTELALNPPELGKVRMSLTAQDSTIVMMVQADRPETSDMMRRHIDVLEQEFRALGYGSISFEFGETAGEQNNTNGDSNATPQAEADDVLASADPETILQQTVRLGGLDLRL